MRHRDIVALMAGVAPVVKDYVATIAKRLDELAKDFDATLVAFGVRIKAIEDRKVEKGERGEPGEQGLAGPPGPVGPQGEKGDPGEPGIAGLQGLDGPAGERGDKGEDGRDGRDGLPGIQGEKGLDGKDGRDGINGKDGRDGVGYDDMVEELEDGGRWLVRKYLHDGVVIKEFRHVTAMVIYRGVYREGQSYHRGDTVSYGGSMWHANGDTSEKPEASKAWQLAVKRGRDGKEGKDGRPGERGPSGPPGLNGRAAYGA